MKRAEFIRRAERAHVWSNLFFVVPIVMGVRFGIAWFAALVFWMMTVSFLFHINKVRDWGLTLFGEPGDEWLAQRMLWLDNLSSILVMFIMLRRLVTVGFTNIWALAALIAGVIGVLIFFAEFNPILRNIFGYSREHAAWHFWAAVSLALASVAIAGV